MGHMTSIQPHFRIIIINSVFLSSIKANAYHRVWGVRAADGRKTWVVRRWHSRPPISRAPSSYCQYPASKTDHVETWLKYFEGFVQNLFNYFFIELLWTIYIRPFLMLQPAYALQQELLVNSYIYQRTCYQKLRRSSMMRLYIANSTNT